MIPEISILEGSIFLLAAEIAVLAVFFVEEIFDPLN